MQGQSTTPRRALSPADVAALIVGIVIGAGIFRVPADVAAATGSVAGSLLLWLAGGLAALTGALCYAELATRFPSIGGEYHFLRLAWGPRLGALFLWARIAVMQTGAIATVGFVAGDYASAVWPSGPSPAIWAGASVAAVTLANMIGLEAGRRSQILFVGAELLALAAILAAAVALGFGGEAGQVAGSGQPSSGATLGLAFVFVMLAYGGWNEAAYVSAEVRGGPRSMVKALVLGLGLVTLLYIAVNAAFLLSFGVEGLAGTPAPATRLAEAAFGPGFALLIGASVVTAALSTLNATVITGARAMCAGGAHIPALKPLGQWDSARSVPRPALVVQGLIALALTAYGATARDGFTAMVAFGAPVFWLFLALTAASLFRLRRRFPQAQGFSVPLYPLIPLIFLAVTLGMLWSSLGYAQFLLGQSEAGRLAGILGIALLALGIPLAWKAR
ncbi:amino acid permease [Sandaracinobacter sp. RS1-74]|uniref:APC family permease n=1 Tax=Sandaracinobacteroides sayramensis TaxID=2913411 RepID=UPI001EDAFA0F|nr:amino acid permease [Sandaracinobacteroides sayramensis]MCG2842752.1 amino acid permease [Sandaracinobacteroides sayramensis]